MRRRIVAGLTLATLACAPPSAPTFSFAVRVESDPGVPLAGAEVVREGRPLAESDVQGIVSLTLLGAPGEVVLLELFCPLGHRSPAKPISVVLRAQTAATPKPEYRVACPPEQRSLVVSVRAQNGPRLPVKHLGRELARTDEDGAAHVLLRATPGESLTLELDTSAEESRGLSPQNPRLELVMPDHDEVALFDQTFSLPKPKPKRAVEPTGPIPILHR